MFCQYILCLIIHENVQCAACFDYKSSLGTVCKILHSTHSADQCKITDPWFFTSELVVGTLK
jgi:hypothetical protein